MQLFLRSYSRGITSNIFKTSTWLQFTNSGELQWFDNFCLISRHTKSLWNIFKTFFPKLKVVSISSLSICDISHRQNVGSFCVNILCYLNVSWTAAKRKWDQPMLNLSIHKISIRLHFRIPWGLYCSFRLAFTAYIYSLIGPHTRMKLNKICHNFREHSFYLIGLLILIAHLIYTFSVVLLNWLFFGQVLLYKP